MAGWTHQEVYEQQLKILYFEVALLGKNYVEYIFAQNLLYLRLIGQNGVSST